MVNQTISYLSSYKPIELHCANAPYFIILLCLMPDNFTTILLTSDHLRGLSTDTQWIWIWDIYTPAAHQLLDLASVNLF
jgi:hypothetical protein